MRLLGSTQITSLEFSCHMQPNGAFTSSKSVEIGQGHI